MAELKTCVASLAESIYNDCNDSFGKGVEPKVWIFDRSNVDCVLDKESMTITSLTLHQGKVGQYINLPGDEAASGIKVEDQNSVLIPNFTKTAPAILLANSPKNAKAVRALKSGRYILVFELTIKDDANGQAFIAIGAEQGARGQDANWDAYSDDTQGGWAINMVEKNATLPQVFVVLGETAAETRAALDGMLTAAA
uniref:hypothetical protein n=1 Tax=Alistipes sp. TaxID=1872444 RepID=UPI004055E086